MLYVYVSQVTVSWRTVVILNVGANKDTECNSVQLTS